jgi:hypothetical protein
MRSAETAIDGPEESEDYRGFGAAVIADNDARAAVERALVVRLASPLWRMQRVISIKTDLPGIKSEIARERRDACPPPRQDVSPCHDRESHKCFLDTRRVLDRHKANSSQCSPPMSAGDFTYCFWLGMSTTGRLSGWGATMLCCGSKPHRRFFCSGRLDDLRRCRRSRR